MPRASSKTPVAGHLTEPLWQKKLPLFFLITGFCIYFPSLSAPFIFDDNNVLMSGNPFITSYWRPQWTDIFAHRSLAYLTYGINHLISEFDPRGFHVFNVTAHIFSALLLFGVVRRTLILDSMKLQYGNIASGLAFSIALIWLVHPLATQSVIYLAQRSELLLAFFCFSLFYCFLRSVQSQNASKWKVIAVVSCALGHMGKEIMMAAPFLLFLYDRTFLTGSFRETWRQRGKFYGMLILTGLLSIKPLLQMLGVISPEGSRISGGFLYKDITPLKYALTETGVILHYLKLCFWPHPLVLDYAWHFKENFTQALPETAVVLGLFGYSIWAVFKKPAVGFLCAWFFVILAPTSSFIPVADAAFEQRMYVPLGAVVTLAVFGIHSVLRKVSDASWQKAAILLLGTIFIIFSVLTFRRSLDYRTVLSIWSDTVAKRPENGRAHQQMAIALMFEKRYEESFAHYAEAVRLLRVPTDAHVNWGLALVEYGNWVEGMEHYNKAIAINRRAPEAHYNLAVILAQHGEQEAAVHEYKQELHRNPKHVLTYNNLANLLMDQGSFKAALRYYHKAIHISPKFAPARVNYGILLRRLGRVEEAAALYEEGLRMAPKSAPLRNAYGAVLFQQKRISDALREFSAAAELDPDFQDAKDNIEMVKAVVARRIGA